MTIQFKYNQDCVELEAMSYRWTMDGEEYATLLLDILYDADSGTEKEWSTLDTLKVYV